MSDERRGGEANDSAGSPRLSPAQTRWLRRRYGAKAAEVLRDDPWRLAREVPGIGFKTADAIARQIGKSPESPARLRAGILHCLRERAEDGDLCLPFHQLVRVAQAVLEVDRRLVAATLEELGRDGDLVIESAFGPVELDRLVYLPELRAAEVGVARALLELAGSPAALVAGPPALEAEIAARAASVGIVLAAGQIEALRAALTRRLAVITGGPGTGKTTVLKTLLAATAARGVQVALAAPTGKAAARMAEATGREAKTIHRLLEFTPGVGFRRNRANPLDADFVVVDEASMVDTPLMHRLLEALPRGDRRCALLLVGDADQLPSVGPGQVLRDLIASGIAPVVHLTEAFRQAKESDIVAAAHRILQGMPPEQQRSRGQGDFLFVEEADAARAVRTVVELVADRVPRRLSVDPLDGIQVLAPMHKGIAGSTGLNRALQAALNPDGAPVPAAEPMPGSAWPALKVGDKVIQRRNNYEKGVFNGDVGRIVAAGRGESAVVVSFDGLETGYRAEEVGQLSPAYALSVHKAQGSEYPAVVLTLFEEHAAMLERTLLYTAVTRARRLMAIVGSRGALATAVRRTESRSRRTGLAERLRAGCPR